MPEAAVAPLRLPQARLSDQFEDGLFDPDQHQFRDAIAPAHRVVVLGIVVHQHDLELAPVAGVDQPWSIEAGQPVADGQPTPRQHEPGEPAGDGDGHPCRDHGPAAPAGQHDVDAGDQVGAAIAFPGVAGHRQLIVELLQGDTQHRRTLQGLGQLPPWARPVACARMLAWIDLEMTGLDPARHTIVEIASLITDDNLQLVEEGPDLVVHASPEQLAEMDDYVRTMHTRSGLLAAMEASTLSLADAGAQTLAFLKGHIPEARKVPLAGNSIGTDRRFLATQLPEIEDYLNYRSVDVSTVKELCRRWLPNVYKSSPEKKGGHRALQDIRESVAELAYYRGAVFDRAAETEKETT